MTIGDLYREAGPVIAPFLLVTSPNGFTQWTKGDQMNFLDAYIVAVAKDNEAIPIGVIQAIIAFIMQMISMCPAPPTPAGIKTPTNESTIRMMQALRANGIRPLSKEGRGLLASMHAQNAALSDTDAQTFITSCSQTGG